MRARSSGPDFLSVGMQKTGTGWLYDQLKWHPSIWLPPVKEIHYLVGQGVRHKRRLERLISRDAKAINENRSRRGVRPVEERDLEFYRTLLVAPDEDPDLSHYEKLFAMKGGQISGDITPAYSIMAPERIADVVKRFPNLRVVLGIRDPIERFWSQVSQFISGSARIGRELNEKDWVAVSKFLVGNAAALRSYPTRVAANWRAHFPAEQFLVIFFDDLRVDPKQVRTTVLEFLGVDPQQFPADIPAEEDRKATRSRVEMPPEIHQRLIDHFADEIRACAATFGGPALAWPGKHGL